MSMILLMYSIIVEIVARSGHIVFEWWNRNDKLTLYVTDTAFIAIRSSDKGISETEYSSMSDCVNQEFSWITNVQI
jgi:hypothetical protein